MFIKITGIGNNKKLQSYAFSVIVHCGKIGYSGCGDNVAFMVMLTLTFR